MLVIDYPQVLTVTNPILIIPSFHTGHLGFVPKTEVAVQLLGPPPGGSEYSAAAELVVSPFRHPSRDLVALSATMHDEIGVVSRLVRAVYDLTLNIEVQESSSIHHLDEHSVNLVVQLGSAPAATDERTRRLYRDFAVNVPLHDGRLIDLFERIMARCADKLIWRSIRGSSVPEIYIRSMDRPGDDPPDFVPVEKMAPAPKTGLSRVRIALPRRIVEQLRARLSREEFTYILVSDTEQRTLRAFFLRPQSVDRLFHVAFYHNDVSGALATVQGAVAGAGFNILTSLLRKETVSRSVWEALLLYRGSVELEGSPPWHPTAAVLEWVRNKIEPEMPTRASGPKFEIQIGPPLYPLYPRRANERLPLREPALGEVEKPLTALVEEMLARMKAGNTVANDGAKQLLETIQHRHLGLPRIFLSYPREASRHGEKLKVALDKTTRYDVNDYQTNRGEHPDQEVVKKIQHCDYMIGVWHPDKRITVKHPQEANDTKFGMSPWLSYEYGVASALGKPCLIVRSHELSDVIWGRIDPSKGRPDYTDIDFDRVIEAVLEYCKKHFL